jgi:hypothetical protein
MDISEIYNRFKSKNVISNNNLNVVIVKGINHG